jgi:hypothetical protein
MVSTLSLTSALDGMGGRRHAPAALPPGLSRAHFIGDWGAAGSVWMGVDNIAPTGVRSPVRPARS